MSALLHASRAAGPSARSVTLAFIYIYLAWGVTFLAIHYAVTAIPPLIMAGSRFFIAGTIMLALLRLLRPADFLWGSAKEWKDAAIVALLLLDGGNGTQAVAQRTVPTGMTALLFGSLPLWIILFDWLRPGGTAPSRRAGVGLVLGFIGVIVLVHPSSQAATTPALFFAELSLLFSACSFAAGGIYSRYARALGSPLLPMARQMLVGGSVLLLVTLFDGEWHGFDPGHVTTAAWLGFFYLVIFGSLIGFTIYVWLMQVSTPARVGTISYANLLVAVSLGWWLLQEPLTWRVVIGAVITLGAVAIVLRKPKTQREIVTD